MEHLRLGEPVAGGTGTAGGYDVADAPQTNYLVHTNTGTVYAGDLIDYADSAAGGEIYSGRAGTYDWDDASADRRCSGAGDDERYYYYDSPAMGRE